MQTIPLEELRLGNLVSINNKVVEIDKEIMLKIIKGVKGYEPMVIPINETLLKSLGFWEKKIRVKYWFNDYVSIRECLCYSFFAFCLHYDKEDNQEVEEMFLGKIELDKINDGLDYFNDSVLPPIYKGTGLHRLQNAISEKTAFKDLEYNLNINAELIKGQSTI